MRSFSRRRASLVLLFWCDFYESCDNLWRFSLRHRHCATFSLTIAFSISLTLYDFFTVRRVLFTRQWFITLQSMGLSIKTRTHHSESVSICRKKWVWDFSHKFSTFSPQTQQLFVKSTNRLNWLREKNLLFFYHEQNTLRGAKRLCLDNELNMDEFLRVDTHSTVNWYSVL